MKKEHKIYEFIIGRFQPPHEGHLELIRTVLKEGKNVCIALRDTNINLKNPYSYEERHRVFQKIFYKEIGEGRIKIIRIPDIENVIYGRKPGWGLREIRLSKRLENINGTEIRKNNK